MLRKYFIAAVLIAVSAMTALAQVQDLSSLSDFDYLKHHLKVISADDFGGRKPMTPYETKTINYIRDYFIDLGLLPAGEDGYFQTVPEIKTKTSFQGGSIEFKGKKGKVKVTALDDIIPWTVRYTDRVDLKNVEVVFAGYGATAPEYGWDDFGDIDVSGKLLLVLENDPGVYNNDIFTGRSMTYYGRADCKFKEAQRRGAAGCLVIHIPGASAYTFAALQGSHGEQEISLVNENLNSDALGLSGWITEEAAKNIFKIAGADYDAALSNARNPGFKAMPLNAKLNGTLDVKAEIGESHNVVGMLPGTDLKDECVVVSAHWDHLGIGNPVDGDAIYNGAGDNASGVAAMLTHIRRFMAEDKLRRSIVFVAVTSEEDGLLGSEWYSKHPVFPVSKTAGAVNIDGGAPLGKSKNIAIFAGGLSTVDNVIRALGAAQGRRVELETMDTGGIFYRTDIFNFIRTGVPGVHVCSGGDYVDPEEHRKHVNPPYHHPKDEWDENWDMSGVMDHWNLVHGLIEMMANQNEMQQWLPGSGYSRP